MSDQGSSRIESVSTESRVFPPPAAFAASAGIGSHEAYDALYARSINDSDAFWAEQASAFHWFAPHTQVLDWQPPHAKWFVGGTTNLAYNCLDRHLAGPRADATAIVFEGEPGDVVRYTYRELHAEVCRLANALSKLGVVAGDRVGIYMGMVPEAAMGMLACARLGAVHTVIFGGFAADAIRDRLNDAGAKVVLTQDSAWRRGARVPLKAQVDRAIVDVPSVQHVVVLQRMAEPVVLGEREHDWRALVAGEAPTHEAPALDS